MALWRTEDGGLFDPRSAANRNTHLGVFNGPQGWHYIRLEDGTEALVQSQLITGIQVTPPPLRTSYSGQHTPILEGPSS